MVECDDLPITLRVAGLTFFSIRPPVFVIFLVAGEAL